MTKAPDIKKVLCNIYLEWYEQDKEDVLDFARYISQEVEIDDIVKLIEQEKYGEAIDRLIDSWYPINSFEEALWNTLLSMLERLESKKLKIIRLCKGGKQ